MKRSINKEVLFDYFDGKTTSLQRKLIEEWLSHPGNTDLYYQYLDEWESKRIQYQPDEETALEKFRSVMNSGSEMSDTVREPSRSFQPAPSKRYRNIRWIGIAASLLIIACLIWSQEILYRKVYSPVGMTTKHELPDGTTVLLNSNSSLHIPRFRFSDQNRRVKLHGEAEFHVTHISNSSRFLVEMEDGYFVEVLGTKFVAMARSGKKRVYLSEGKVKLKLPEGRHIYMQPGYLFEASQDRKASLKIPEDPKEYLVWKDHQFYFDNPPLPEVIQQMEERFGVKIVLHDPVLQEKRLGGIFEAKSVDDLLQVLSELYQVQIVENDKLIEIKSGSNH